MNLLTRLADDMRLMFRRPPRLQFGALCHRINAETGAREILLLTSRDTGRWVIPKGWPMAGKAAHEVAAQEALEEAGVLGEVGADDVGYFDYRKMMKDGFALDCRVKVYPLAFTDFVRKYKEKGQRKRRWFAFEEAARLVNEPMLKTLILAFGQANPPPGPESSASGTPPQE